MPTTPKTTPTKNKRDVPQTDVSDKFLTFWQKILDWLIARSPMIGLLILVVVVALTAAWGVKSMLASRKEKAAEQLSKAVKIAQAELLRDTESSSPDNELPRFKTEKERAEAAIKALDKLRADHGGSEAADHAALVRASILMQQGKYDEARAAYEEFLKKPVQNEALYGAAREALGLCAEAQGKIDEALKIWQEAAASPNAGFYKDRFLFAQARLLVQKGEKKKAAELYKDILAKSPQSTLKDEINNRLLALED